MKIAKSDDGVVKYIFRGLVALKAFLYVALFVVGLWLLQTPFNALLATATFLLCLTDSSIDYIAYTTKFPDSQQYTPVENLPGHYKIIIVDVAVVLYAVAWGIYATALSTITIDFSQKGIHNCSTLA